MKKILNLIIAIFLLSIVNLSAQIPTLEVGGSTDQSKVYLKDLDVKVNVIGNISTTTMTMVFQNKTTQQLEGTLTFPLPEGVTVSGYALDINGKMRDAVPVDKSKGTQVFEEIERRRVDPGLLEKVEGNNFRTRIYPIPGQSSRTISISYEEVLSVSNNKYTYRLPMSFDQPINKFGLTLQVWQKNKPIVEAGNNEIKFDKHNNAYISSFSRTNYTPSKLLSFSVPTQTEADVIMESASGSYYFMVNYLVKNKEKREKKWSDAIGIIWDASLSNQSKDIEKELILLDAIISSKQNLKIKLGLLNNTFTKGGEFTIKNGDWSDLRKTLLDVVYDGGTKYNAIDLNKISSNEYILFSDGISTLSEASFKQNKQTPIHCIVSSPMADYSNLKSIAINSKGKFVNLNGTDIATAKEDVLYDSFMFLGIKNNGNVSQVYPSIPTPVNELFSISGISNTENNNITLEFGYGNTITEEKTIALNSKGFTNNDIDVHKLWAQKKIQELDLEYEKNKDEIMELSQQFGIVTRNTSLIVLEEMADYIRYGITPPQELITEYNKYLGDQTARQNQQRQQIISEQANLLQLAKNDMTQLKTWWNTEFKLPQNSYPKPDKKKPSNKNSVQFTSPVIKEEVAKNSDEMMMSMDVMDLKESKDVLIDEFIVGNASINKKSVSASVSIVNEEKMLKENSNNDSYIPQQTKLTMIDIKNDAEYMKRLTGDNSNDYKIYIEERKNYGGTPSFYFNMADWFMKHNDPEKALSILTSIAEIGLENIGAYKMLAFRLKEYNEPEMLLFVTKKLKEWRPFEQQSYRDYALALKESGQYQQALDSLYSSMTSPKNNTQQNADLGMNMVLLNDINNLISLHGKELNTSAIDTALIYSMPVDIRVVINWSVPQTHIDMQITDPQGEMVTYNHNRSQIGGRLDAHEIMDFGPEQFLLKKGMKGKYTIQVDYWGSSNVSSTSEPATIMTEIYIGYSSGKEERKIVCFNLSNANIDKAQKKVTIAEFEI